MRRSSPEEQAAWRHESQQYCEDGPDVNDHPPEEPYRDPTDAEIRAHEADEGSDLTPYDDLPF